MTTATVLARQPTAPESAAGPRSATTGEFAALIAQLGNPEYDIRETAEKRLAELGFAAYDALAAAEQHDDPEIAARARYLLRQITVTWNRPEDAEEVRKLLADYDELADLDRLKRIESLGALRKEAGTPALSRIARFERSEVLSKRAAMLLCSAPDCSQQRAESITREVGESQRTASRWLLAHARETRDLPGSAQQWSLLVAEEQKTRVLRPEATPEDVLAWMQRRQANLLRRAEQPEEAARVITEIVGQESGEPESLERLIRWLITEQAWGAVDEVAKRFAQRVPAEPALAYALAEARQLQGRQVAADQLATTALDWHAEQLDQHAEMAGRLWQRGLSRWAEAEFKLVIDKAPSGSYLSLRARRVFAEMLYDALDFQRAADVLEACALAMDENVKARREAENGEPVSHVWARVHFFRAQQWAEQGDTAQQVEFLDKATAQYPLDADVLIAIAALPDRTAEQRQQLARWLEQAANEYREELSQSPQDASLHNQLAWLLSNTGGNLDEALEASRKSLEIEPETAAYLDTLGRVHYARGEHAQAVEFQARAVESSPHSGLMRRQLALFQAALAKAAPSESHP